jgi:uncharacterized membrane protein YdbT with pleckstrin-like domain
MVTQTLTYRCPHCDTPIEIEPQSAAEGTMLCPNPTCQQPFKVAVPAAEPVPKLLVPGNGVAEPEPAEPLPHAVPAPQQEAELQQVRLDMLRRYPFRFAGYLLLAVTAVAGLVVAALQEWLFLALLSGLLLIYVAYRLTAWYLVSRNTALTLTNQRCILSCGGLDSCTTEVPYKEISDVQVRQSLFNRWLDIGDVIITTSGAERKQIVLRAVPHPATVAGEVRQRR